MWAAAGGLLTFLDSVLGGSQLRPLVLSTRVETTPVGRRNEIERLIVVDATVLDSSIKIVATRILEEPTLYPNGCGAYLKGARVLTGTDKTLLIYAQKLRIVDFSAYPTLGITIANDTSIPGGASTCEGYTPNWDAERDTVSVDFAGRSITQLIRSRKSVEQPEEKRISTPEEFDFYRRIYQLECEGRSTLRKSQTCRDLKRARDEGVFVTRRLVYPIEPHTVQY